MKAFTHIFRQKKFGCNGALSVFFRFGEDSAESTQQPHFAPCSAYMSKKAASKNNKRTLRVSIKRPTIIFFGAVFFFVVVLVVVVGKNVHQIEVRRKERIAHCMPLLPARPKASCRLFNYKVEKPVFHDE